MSSPYMQWEQKNWKVWDRQLLSSVEVDLLSGQRCQKVLHSLNFGMFESLENFICGYENSENQFKYTVYTGQHPEAANAGLFSLYQENVGLHIGIQEFKF